MHLVYVFKLNIILDGRLDIIRSPVLNVADLRIAWEYLLMRQCVASNISAACSCNISVAADM